MNLPKPGETESPWASRITAVLQDYLTRLEQRVQKNATSIPAGVVVEYAKADVPRGWIICDGRHGTPDKRPKTFIMKINKRQRAVK